MMDYRGSQKVVMTYWVNNFSFEKFGEAFLKGSWWCLVSVMRNSHWMPLCFSLNGILILTCLSNKRKNLNKLPAGVVFLPSHDAISPLWEKKKKKENHQQTEEYCSKVLRFLDLKTKFQRYKIEITKTFKINECISVKFERFIL